MVKILFPLLVVLGGNTHCHTRTNQWLVMEKVRGIEASFISFGIGRLASLYYL
ncbi:hypothetical protein [Bacillus sp. SD075]|uniref:hypothetical protein n=1 Tax=Bacillus sp. SD075 TaxID=2781732 RepID=UPI002570A48A|nr:hypothetical protein [Bacillus sp. SD075]